jgi:hypothetical protein
MTTVVSGCGLSTAVQGTPVAQVKIPSIDNTTPSVSATPTTGQPAPETPPSTAETPASEAADVVQAYFDAINARDYQRAWDLGGKNVGHTYSAFAAGFATTDHDTVTIQSVQGNTVTADLVAVQADGTQRTFHGTYTVANGIITKFSVRATG